jgi:sulfoxide reductase heme-binding subunit YedZ
VLGVVALLHYFIQSKSNVSEPVFMSGLFVWLMLWRTLPMGWQRSLLAQLALTVVAACATAGIEFAWYALATGVNPWRVFAVNWSISFGLRPAHYVLLCGLIPLSLRAAGEAIPWWVRNTSAIARAFSPSPRGRG